MVACPAVVGSHLLVSCRTSRGSRPRVAVTTKRCSLRGEEANSHQRRTAPWRKEYPLAPGLNRPSPAWVEDGKWDPDRLAELGRFGAQLIIQRAVEEEVSTFLGRAHYERSPSARGWRNGVRSRRVQTGEGELVVEVPLCPARPRRQGDGVEEER